MARRNLRPSGQEGGRGIAGGAATVRTRRALVVTEFALAIILLVGAGLLVRSLWSAQNVDLGFRPERVLSVSLAPPASTATAQRADFYKRVLEQIESLPSVESAGIDIGSMMRHQMPYSLIPSIRAASKSGSPHVKSARVGTLPGATWTVTPLGTAIGFLPILDTVSNSSRSSDVPHG